MSNPIVTVHIPLDQLAAIQAAGQFYLQHARAHGAGSLSAAVALAIDTLDRPVAADPMPLPVTDQWVPANGGTEQVFVARNGARLLYCWNPALGRHAYLDCGSDTILSDLEAEQMMHPEWYREAK